MDLFMALMITNLNSIRNFTILGTSLSLGSVAWVTGKCLFFRISPRSRLQLSAVTQSTCPTAYSPLGQSYNAKSFRAALQIYAPTDAFIAKLLAEFGSNRNLFSLDEALARKWVLSSISREKCQNGIEDGDKRVKMLNQVQNFTCNGKYERFFQHPLIPC